MLHTRLPEGLTDLSGGAVEHNQLSVLLSLKSRWMHNNQECYTVCCMDIYTHRKLTGGDTISKRICFPLKFTPAIRTLGTNTIIIEYTCHSNGEVTMGSCWGEWGTAAPHRTQSLLWLICPGASWYWIYPKKPIHDHINMRNYWLINTLTSTGWKSIPYLSSLQATSRKRLSHSAGRRPLRNGM